MESGERKSSEAVHPEMLTKEKAYMYMLCAPPNIPSLTLLCPPSEHSFAYYAMRCNNAYCPGHRPTISPPPRRLLLVEILAQ